MIIEVCPHCGADLEPLTYTTYPPIHAHICRNCGWQQEERENITRVSIATVNRKKPTNADRIRAKSDDEMASWLALHPCLPNCPAQTDECFKSSKLENCTKQWLDWLKSSANK